MHLRVVTYNVLDGGAGREALLAEVLEALAPNVVFLQEVADDSLPNDLAARLGMQHYVATGNQWRRLAVLSRLPILTAQSHHPRPAIHRSILHATLGPVAGEPLHVWGVHLMALPLFAMEARRMW